LIVFHNEIKITTIIYYDSRRSSFFSLVVKQRLRRAPRGPGRSVAKGEESKKRLISNGWAEQQEFTRVCTIVPTHIVRFKRAKGIH
jgi:hypothetical protein